MKSVFFMPVFDQILEFPQVLEELKSAPLPVDAILIVNNGSSDGSEHLVRTSGYDFIDIPSNQGTGYSFIRAIDWALERDFDIIGTMASNGKMLPAQMHRLLDPVKDGKVDYATGSRFLKEGDFPNLPYFRRMSIPMVNLFVNTLYGVSLTDATCGYRAMRLEIFRKANFDWHASWLYGYSMEYYVFAKVIHDKKWRWMEVPVTMRYPPKGVRYSKIKPFIGWWDMLKPWLVARVDGKGFGHS